MVSPIWDIITDWQKRKRESRDVFFPLDLILSSILYNSCYACMLNKQNKVDLSIKSSVFFISYLYLKAELLGEQVLEIFIN